MTLNKSLLIPLVVFILLILLLALGFTLKDPHFLPSELIDKPFPEFSLSDLYSGKTRTREDVIGDIVLVNVWATWCPNCLIEHPELTRIAAHEGVTLVGVNYNDESAKARNWLRRHGDPYSFHIVDNDGRLAIDLGVYGAPETFVVDQQGVIRYRHVGPVTRDVWQRTLAPVIDLLESGA